MKYMKHYVKTKEEADSLSLKIEQGLAGVGPFGAHPDYKNMPERKKYHSLPLGSPVEDNGKQYFCRLGAEFDLVNDIGYTHRILYPL